MMLIGLLFHVELYWYNNFLWLIPQHETFRFEDYLYMKPRLEDLPIASSYIKTFDALLNLNFIKYVWETFDLYLAGSLGCLITIYIYTFSLLSLYHFLIFKKFISFILELYKVLLFRLCYTLIIIFHVKYQRFLLSKGLWYWLSNDLPIDSLIHFIRGLIRLYCNFDYQRSPDSLHILIHI